MSNTETRLFTYEKSTKRTDRYAEDESGQPMLIGTIYVQKWFSQGVKKLKVVVEKKEE